MYCWEFNFVHAEELTQFFFGSSFCSLFLQLTTNTMFLSCVQRRLTHICKTCVIYSSFAACNELHAFKVVSIFGESEGISKLFLYLLLQPHGSELPLLRKCINNRYENKEEVMHVCCVCDLSHIVWLVLFTKPNIKRQKTCVYPANPLLFESCGQSSS